MNELQRQAYMEAMGVDSYVPRLVLPAALPSQLCEWPVMEASPASPSPVSASPDTITAETPAPVRAAGNGSAAAMQALLGENAKPSVKKVAPAASQGLVKANTNKKAVPHFSLSIISGNNILIVDESLPGHVNPEDYLLLLHNMLFALGVGKQQLSIDTFNWPVSKNSQVDQSETAARQAIDAFLAKKSEQLKSQYLIVMGASAANFVTNKVLVAGVLTRHDYLDIELIHTSSASPMLSDALLKRKVWQDLKPLHAAIKTH
jgi:hypothetical protein